MIATLTGTLTYTGQSDAIIQVGGVGYRFNASSRCLQRLGGIGAAEITVLTETIIKDDSITLIGFSDAAVMESFKVLQTVQGVGVKAALAILSALSPDDLMLALSSADKAMITRADGVGPKLAQRIINELAEKVVSLGSAEAIGDTKPDTAMSKALADSISALVNLGYGRAEAHMAVTSVLRGMDEPTLEEALPLALKELGR